MHVPFGLQFAESQPDGAPLPPLTYDDEHQVSMVALPDGRKVPYLSLPILPGTTTFTRVQAEQDDVDALTTSLGTQTHTAVHSEQQDEDPGLSYAVGTNTQTFVTTEQPDSDR